MKNRNWFNHPDRSWTCERSCGDIECCVPHLVIEFKKDLVIIKTYNSGKGVKTEIFQSKDEINGFIEALQEARDIAFA